VPNLLLLTARRLGDGRMGTEHDARARTDEGLVGGMRQGVYTSALTRRNAEAHPDTVAERHQAVARRRPLTATERRPRLGSAEVATGGHTVPTSNTLLTVVLNTAAATAVTAPHHGVDIFGGGGRVDAALIERPPMAERVLVALRGRVAVHVGGRGRDDFRVSMVDGGGGHCLRTAAAGTIPPC
jgi:hypothetical protein